MLLLLNKRKLKLWKTKALGRLQSSRDLEQGPHSCTYLYSSKKKCSQLITWCLLFKAWECAGLKPGGRIRCPLLSSWGPVAWDPHPLPQTLTHTLSVGDTGGKEVRGVVDSPPGTDKLSKLSRGTWSPGSGMSHILYHLALSEPWPYNMQTLPARWIRGVWELLWSGQRR